MNDDATAPTVNRKLLVLLGVVAALAMLVVFVVNPLLFGGAEDPASLGAPPVPAADAAPAPEPTVEPEPEPVPETFEIFNARDPFQQLVEETPEGAEGGAQSGAGGGTSITGGGQDQQAIGTIGGGSTTGGSNDGSGTPQQAVVGATQVKLLDVVAADDGSDLVVVDVNGTGYRAGEGDVFADRFRVLDISGDCATFLFGDSRFTLCKGEAVRK